MMVTETLSDGLRRAFAVVVPAAEIESKCGAKLAEIGRTIRLPGFRPGKVPVNLVRQRYGASVMAEVMQDAITTAADQLVEERGLRPAGQPKIALTQQPRFEKARASDLNFSVELDLLPDIVPPDLRALTLVRWRAEVAPERVEATLAMLARQRRALIPVEEDRGAGLGETLTVDFLGTVDGEAFEGGKGEDAMVEVGGAGFIPGFAEGMEGMKPGETRDIALTFPAEYPVPALAGKAAVFHVTAKSLARSGEALTEAALAAELGFESPEKLRETILAQMQRELDQMARLRIKRELLDVLAEKADFPAPNNLVDAEFGAIWQRVEQDLKAGQVDEEDRGKDAATLMLEYRAIADRRVRLGLLLSEIGRKANIQVSQAEITQALRQEAARHPGQEMQVVEFFRKTPNAIEQLRGPLFEDKVVDYILEMAQVEERIVPSEELALPPADPATEPQKLSFAATPEPEAPEPPHEPDAATPALAAQEFATEAPEHPATEAPALAAPEPEAHAADPAPEPSTETAPPHIVGEAEASPAHTGEAAA